ncbi:MAG: hypothetical protein LBC70_08780 [Chitinispirillales bacterium]|jgi:hypothetical protein|nr:hypothetical protein [Chitinispirillales bacterium]
MSNDTKNAGAAKNTAKKERPLWLVRSFGTRRVFAAYIVCVVITVLTMVFSIITVAIDITPYKNLIGRLGPYLAPGGSGVGGGFGTYEKLIEHLGLCVGGLFFLALPVVIHRKYNLHFPPFIYIGTAFLIFAHFVMGEIYRFYDYVFLYDKILHIIGGVVIAMYGFSIVNGFSKTKDGPIKLSPFFTAMFSFCFAATLLVLWEFFEYGVDYIGGFNMQRWMDSLGILTAATGEVSDFSVIRSWSGQLKIALESTGDTLNFAIRHWQNTPDNTMYLVTSDAQGSGLIDTMDDLIVGAIGALAVSIIGALSLKKNPDNKKFMVVRNKPSKGQAETSENQAG